MTEQIILRYTMTREELEAGKKQDFAKLLVDMVREDYRSSVQMLNNDLERIEYAVWLEKQQEGAD